MTDEVSTAGRRRKQFANGETLTQSTPASVWRESSTMLVRLPGCDQVARLRRPSLIALATLPNGVPNPLSDKVIKLMMRESGKTDADAARVWQRNNQALIEVAAMCLVAPRLVLDREPDYSADEIGPGDLADRDYTWIYFEFIEGEASQLDRFRIGETARSNGSVTPL